MTWLQRQPVQFEKDIHMKRISTIVLLLCVSLVFAVGCDNTNQQETGDSQAPSAVDEQAPQPVALDDFVETQNGMFATMNSEELAIVVSSEGTTLIYTYQYFREGLYEEIGQNAWEQAANEGDLLFDTAKAAVPEITAVRIVFEDGAGNVLRSEEFRE